jgi:hypothetical protein
MHRRPDDSLHIHAHVLFLDCICGMTVWSDDGSTRLECSKKYEGVDRSW